MSSRPGLVPRGRLLRDPAQVGLLRQRLPCALSSWFVAFSSREPVSTSLENALDVALALFGDGKPQHVDHLTAFTAESFGGPERFSREPGFAYLIAVHRGLRIREEQRARFVELYMAALDKAELPKDKAFRDAFREHVEFGSHVAMQNSNATTDDELHPLRSVPKWTWPGDKP